MEAISQMNKDRIEWVDVYRGLGILLVVIGHLQMPDLIIKYIFLFHMYAFYYISGRLHKRISIKEFLKKTVVRLYIPFLIYSSMWMIYERGIAIVRNGGWRNISVLFHEVITILFSLIYGTTGFVSGYNFGPAWFLISLLTVRLIYLIFEKISKGNRLAVVLLSLSLYVIGILCTGWNKLPFMLMPSLSGLFYYAIGDSSKHLSNEFFFKTPVALILLLIVVSLSVGICSLSSTKLLLISNFHDYWIFDMLGGISGCLILECLSRLIVQRFRVSYLQVIGQETILILGIHSEIRVIIQGILKMMGMPVSDMTLIVRLLYCLFNLAFTLTVCHFLFVFVETRIPILIGKKKDNIK